MQLKQLALILLAGAMLAGSANAQTKTEDKRWIKICTSADETLTLYVDSQTIRRETDAARKIFYCGILAAFGGYLLNDFFIFSAVSVTPTFFSLIGITLALQQLGSAEGGNHV